MICGGAAFPLAFDRVAVVLSLVAADLVGSLAQAVWYIMSQVRV